MSLNDYGEMVHKNSVEHGFWDNYPTSDFNQWVSMQLMLINSELVEVMNVLREGDSWDDFDEEIIDAIIRLFDLGTGLGVDLDKTFIKKMNKNKSRPFMHNKKF